MPENKSKTVFLFYGEDTYSSSQKLKFWQQEFAKKYGDVSSIEIIEWKDLDVGAFNTNISALPFLSEKKLIIVKNFLSLGKPDDQKSIAENLDKTPDFCLIVFFENEIPDRRSSLFQKIKRIGQIEEFPFLPPEKLGKWIMDQVKTRSIHLSLLTANYLATTVGSDLWTMKNELEKLALFAGEKEITKEMIDELVTPSLFASIFKLTDAIAEKNLKNAIKTLKILLDSGEEVGKIFFMIVRHFRILIQVHDLIQKKENPFTISKKLKQHPFVIKTTSYQSKNFTLEKLADIYDKLLKIDIGVKTGIIKSFQGDNKEFNLAIEKFIINACK